MIRPPNRRKMIRRVPQGGVAVEIGVFRGRFARQIWNTVRPDKLYLVDPWEDTIRWHIDDELRECPGEESYQIVREVFWREIEDGSVVTVRQPSPEALALIPEPIDFVYIDGDHIYESVLADLEGVWPLMVPGGWICGHDYCEIFEHGVPRAVAEFCSRHDLRINMLTDEPLNPVRGERLDLNASVPDMVAFNSYGIQVPL